jgi:hypothetical protein
MSKHETHITECFWETCTNGALLLEYPLVRRRGLDCSNRLADAVILPDEPHHRASVKDYPSLADHNVVVVQTKAGRMGMYLMGQAVFSARLAVASGAACVRSILLCRRSDSALLPLLKDFPEVEVWLFDDASLSCKRVR